MARRPAKMTHFREHAVNTARTKRTSPKNGCVRGVLAYQRANPDSPDISNYRQCSQKYQELTAKPDNPDMPGHPGHLSGTPPRTDIHTHCKCVGYVRVSCPAPCPSGCDRRQKEREHGVAREQQGE
jgi:hypothetical protein